MRDRFVREVLSRVPRERVAELFLFAPARQGAVESGVAVVAATPAGADDELELDAGGGPDAAPARRGPARHTVYVARYTLVVRGPERGRWQVAVREEADAPLLTVEAVVRGVERRAGDDAPPERLDAEACARLVDVTTTTP